jgi:CheY-like chemotaxis protein
MTVGAEITSRDANGPTPEIRIALLARDRRFVRVTSFLLARHGYAVDATHSPRSLIELLERSSADVVVVDGSDPSNAGARTAALLATLERPRGLVVVDESRDVRPLRAPAAVAKWTSLEDLLDAIQREYRRTQAINGTSNARF